MAKSTTKKGETKSNIDQLIKVAVDMNESLGLDPAIDTELEEGELLDAIKTESAIIGVNPKTNQIEKRVIDEDKKNLSEETWGFLEENNFLDHVKAELEKQPEATATGNRRGQPGVNPFPKRYTRQQALIDVLKDGVTDIAKVISKADDLVVKNGGKSNTDGVKTDLDWFVTVAVGIGVAELKDGKLTLNK